jgi:hypothetical protein
MSRKNDEKFNEEEIKKCPPQHVPWSNPNEERASHKPAKGHKHKHSNHEHEHHQHKQMNQPSTESSDYRKKHRNFAQIDEDSIAMEEGVLSEEEEQIKGATDGYVPVSNPNELQVSNKVRNTAHGTSGSRHVVSSLRGPDVSPGSEALDSPVHHPNVNTVRRRVPIDCIFPGAVREGGLDNEEGNEEDDERTIEVGYGVEDGTIEPSPPTVSAELVDPEEEERIRQQQIEQAVKKELQKAVVGEVVTEVVPEIISNKGRRWKSVCALLILILILIVMAVVLGIMLRPGDQTSTQAPTSAPTQAPTSSAPSGDGGDDENGVGK